MRRVSVASAAPGMVLAHAVYDIKGTPVLAARDVLNERNIALLSASASSEILIEDSRTDDIFVNAIFPPDTEARAMQSLSAVLTALEPGGAVVGSVGLVGLRHPLGKFVGAVYPYVSGEPAIAGSHSIEGYHHVHPVRVAEMALVIGGLAGLGADDLQNLGMAALLMNVGYLRLPAGLLEAPRALTPEEIDALHDHPRRSLEILAASGLERDSFLAIAQHHERWDGSGYPAHRRGGDITLPARILAIADTYVALRSRRPHRDAMRPHEAIEYIIAYAGDLFDPGLVQILVRQLPHYPTGVAVVLNSGESGVVSNPNAGHVARPVVRVCAMNGARVRKTYDLDLSKRENQSTIVVDVDM
jgi:HD-GYP domain-containing protein (c-di-GMP phosphodiesterase class II)